MLRERVTTTLERVRSDLAAAFLEEQSPHVVATSFAAGVFITALPTMWTGLLVMAALVYVLDWVNKVALFSAVVVLNPLVKGGVYVASFGLGSHLLGPIPGVAATEMTLAAGPDVLTRLLIGNTIIAVALSVLGYVGARRTVRSIRDRETAPGEYVSQALSD